MFSYKALWGIFCEMVSWQVATEEIPGPVTIPKHFFLFQSI